VPPPCTGPDLVHPSRAPRHALSGVAGQVLRPRTGLAPAAVLLAQAGPVSASAGLRIPPAPRPRPRPVPPARQLRRSTGPNPPGCAFRRITIGPRLRRGVGGGGPPGKTNAHSIPRRSSPPGCASACSTPPPLRRTPPSVRPSSVTRAKVVPHRVRPTLHSLAPSARGPRPSLVLLRPAHVVSPALLPRPEQLVVLSASSW
jgi:hypothetical protein